MIHKKATIEWPEESIEVGTIDYLFDNSNTRKIAQTFSLKNSRFRTKFSNSSRTLKKMVSEETIRPNSKIQHQV